MEKYKLSKSISINGLNDFDENEVPAKYRQGYYILHEEGNHRSYLINETIKYYIDKFSTPKTKEEVLEEVALDVQSEKEAIAKTCITFFKFLRKRNILVPEDKNEDAISYKPLFKEGDLIKQLSIAKVLANKRFIDIYIAEDKESNKLYVLKLLNKNKLADDKSYQQELENLRHEYELLEKVKHIPVGVNKVQAFQYDANGNAYLLLEYIEGWPLARFIDETEELTQDDCFVIIENLLRAFSLLHQNNLIHGDIHSSNVLVDSNKNVCIIDLGLSVSVDMDGNKVLKFGGVDFYMPPERINVISVKKFSKKPDFYSDVYQIGMLLYVVLYNTLPFTGFIWEELAQNIKESEVPFPATSFLNYPIPEQVIAIVKKCLSKNPEERFLNATEIYKSFKKCVIEEKEVNVN